MARKKTVKSETTTQNTLSAAEETVLKGIEEYMSINIPGIGDFKVRHYLDFATKQSLVSQVEMMYWPTGEYDPVFGQAARDMLVFSAFTDMSFGNDVSAFCAFQNSAEYEAFLHWMPSDYHVLMLLIDQKHQELLARHNTPVALERVCDTVTSVLKDLDQLLTNVQSMMETTVKENGGKKISMQDMLLAMKGLAKKDEQAIATAVLDYQTEKAKLDRQDEAAAKHE